MVQPSANPYPVEALKYYYRYSLINMQDFATITPDQWISNEEACKEQLSAMPSWSQIPLLNSNASHNLPDGSLVRFRGMVQDMFNPEFFFQSFEVFNSVTNDVKVKSGKYRDNSEVLENEKINYTSNLISAQRQTLVAVSIPGFSKWAQRLEDQQHRLSHLEERPSTTNPKRSYEEDEAMEVGDNKTKEQKKTDIMEAEATINGDISSSTVVSKEHLLNFPLPDVSSKSCIVKIYDEDSTLKVNDMIEVVGFLSKDPSLSGAFQPENNALEPEMESKAELMTHNPPPSLVPRVHAVLVKTMEHCNPLVKEPFDQEAVLQQAHVAREHLLKALTELLLGDNLAAEYLICHLIACVYLRQETLTLGSMCLNLSNLPTQRFPNYASQLYDIIQQFVTKSYYLPLTIENMNSMALLPKKDYECNRLTSGVLQLSARTNLVLDETKMQQGRLDSTGVHNIAALGHLIKDQRVEYDFKYYKMEFDADVSVLVLSEGKSLLPSDYHLPLKPEESSLQIFDAIVEAATYYLKEDIMNLIRTYLTHMKMVKYTMSEDLQFVQDDFIAMRAASTPARPVAADDLHRLLVLARLVSLSRGHAALGKRHWDAAVAMERDRQARVHSRTATD